MRVSIATPVYSVARYIERCARSLFEQSYVDLEFVFVDDGRIFAHEMMDKCVLLGNRSLFRHYSQRLNADRDSYDRSVISRLIDGSFFAYLLYFNYCRILRKLSFTANS